MGWGGGEQPAVSGDVGGCRRGVERGEGSASVCTRVSVRGERCAQQPSASATCGAEPGSRKAPGGGRRHQRTTRCKCSVGGCRGGSSKGGALRARSVSGARARAVTRRQEVSTGRAGAITARNERRWKQRCSERAGRGGAGMQRGNRNAATQLHTMGRSLHPPTPPSPYPFHPPTPCPLLLHPTDLHVEAVVLVGRLGHDDVVRGAHHRLAERHHRLRHAAAAQGRGGGGREGVRGRELSSARCDYGLGLACQLPERGRAGACHPQQHAR